MIWHGRRCPTCDGRTDRQTDGRTDVQPITCVSLLTHVKNALQCQCADDN